MPVYDCDKCDREMTLTLSIREHEKGRSSARSAVANPFGHFSAPSCLRHRRNPDRKRRPANPTGVEQTSALVVRLGQAVSSTGPPRVDPAQHPRM
jgi:hypothetical protein